MKLSGSVRRSNPASKPGVSRWVGALLIVLAGLNFSPTSASGLPGRPTNRAARFAVLSDLHVFDTSLGSSGAAYEAYIAADPKMLAQSEAILDAAIDGIAAQNVQFVLVAGDLTKDGEWVDHVRVTRHLARLEQHGVKALVIPGNHDINNSDAVTYLGDTTQPVPTVDPQMFRALYERFGYGQAIGQDSYSLSYVTEPVRGVWVMGLDSCRYEDSRQLGYPVVGGRLKPQTMAWALNTIQEAKARGKQLVAFMHHGVNEHFPAEPVIFADYLVENWADVSAQLAGAGLRVIFTGHYHSQDAAYPMDSTGSPIPTLSDVETSSLVMYPCAYRIATIEDSNLKIESHRVTAIDAPTDGLPFQQFALNFLQDRLPALATYQLMWLFGLPQQQAAQVAPLVADALIANYAGDENPDPYRQNVMNALVASPEPLHTLGLMLWGFWLDPQPADNDLTIPIGTN